jgi:hypothetical protein
MNFESSDVDMLFILRGRTIHRLVPSKLVCGGDCSSHWSDDNDQDCRSFITTGLSASDSRAHEAAREVV